jgi:hypothetical protein
MFYDREFKEDKSESFVSINRFIQFQRRGEMIEATTLTDEQINQRQENVETSMIQNGITYYSTREEAEANVSTHVVPRNCFVWEDGPSGYRWRPIPGTGCAHWVAHELGIDGNPGCYNGRAIRVTQAIEGKSQNNLSDAQIGDIWTYTNHTHCGLVRVVNSNEAGDVVSVQVEHCSSGQGGVVTGNFTSGYFYR